MEKIALFCLFSYRVLQISSGGGDVTLWRFSLNGNITLNCSANDRRRISWYHQNPGSGRLTLLTSLGYVRTRERSRMVFTRTGSNTTSLLITGLTESDAGLYFCGKSMHSEMLFNKPIRLVMEDEPTDGEVKVHSVTEPPEEAEIAVAVTLTERVLIFVELVWLCLCFFWLQSSQEESFTVTSNLNSQQFPVPHVVIPLSRTQPLGQKGTRVEPVILPSLGQNSSNANI
ncbi:uncharacterized protein LOC122335156 [Puntigrus tetrazona]|uniref:uncharacterized protein LOC122335156 n=1 Tax=Puntigrus tetrazona TaxID=1606681 RepID=UPI001C89E637|nr:uncharacterized protein LOC122335156 [Puntigrus tetrazona]